MLDFWFYDYLEKTITLDKNILSQEVFLQLYSFIGKIKEGGSLFLTFLWKNLITVRAFVKNKKLIIYWYDVWQDLHWRTFYKWNLVFLAQEQKLTNMLFTNIDNFWLVEYVWQDNNYYYYIIYGGRVETRDVGTPIIPVIKTISGFFIFNSETMAFNFVTNIDWLDYKKIYILAKKEWDSNTIADLRLFYNLS